MKYYYPQKNSKSLFLTYGTVAHALLASGHTLVDDPCDADAALFSICDVVEMRQLKTFVRSAHAAGIPVIVGGHYAMNFWSAGLLADMVWLGHVWEFAQLQTMTEIEQAPYVWSRGKDWEGQRVSTFYDWKSSPLVRISPKKSYYLGGIGCGNSCAFCFTSATNLHQANDDRRIRQAKHQARRAALHLLVVSNMYVDDPQTTVRDMLASRYLKASVSGGWVRMGIEFATENNRNKYGKPIADNELFAVLRKAVRDGVSLRLFHISGIDTRDDWDYYFDMWEDFFRHQRSPHLVHFNFTSLQVQNYTRLYRDRWDINPGNYISGEDTKRWYQQLRSWQPHVLVGRPSPVQTALWRMGVELSTTEGQLDYWLPLYSRRNKLDAQDMYDALRATGVLDTQRVVFKKRGGTVHVVPEHEPPPLNLTHKRGA